MLIPVCDSVVIDSVLLAGSDTKKAETIIRIMEVFKEDGRQNLEILSQRRYFLVQQNGFLDLTNLRMLEALYWMENTERYARLWGFAQSLNWS